MKGNKLLNFEFFLSRTLLFGDEFTSVLKSRVDHQTHKQSPQAKSQYLSARSTGDFMRKVDLTDFIKRIFLSYQTRCSSLATQAP